MFKDALEERYGTDIYSPLNSGSYAKNTAINTKFDFDLVSTFKRNAFSSNGTLEQMYNDVYDFFYDNNDTLTGNLKALHNLKSIDLGCVADYGSFYIDYNPNEEIMTVGQDAYLEFYAKRKLNEIKFSDANHSFVTFFMQLTRYLQQAIGTIPAIT